MKTGAIIQARMSSSRLPGKVLKQLPHGSGITALEQVVKRIGTCKKVDEVIVATSTEKEDQGIIDLCKRLSVNYYAGSLYNVLERYYSAATKYKLDKIVRITGDCPCIDPDVVDMVIAQHIYNKADFTSNAIKRTFPLGIDVGVMNYKALKEAYEHAEHDYEKEHVTTFFYKTRPQDYKIHIVEAEGASRQPGIRLTLDTPEDYTLLCMVYDYLYAEGKLFGIKEILKLFYQKPWLLNVNANVKQKKVHADFGSEMGEVIAYCETQDLKRVKKLLENTPGI